MSFGKAAFFVEQHFGLVLGIGFVSGFLVPWLDRAPEQTVTVAVAVVMFFSWFKVEPAELGGLSWRRLFSFYLLRFVVLPLLLFFVADVFFPEQALGVLLLSLMPVGVSATPVAGILGGKIELSLALLSISSLLAPYVVPALMETAVGARIELRSLEMFRMLSLVILLPAVLHIPLRRGNAVKSWIREHNSLLTGPLIALMIALVIARRRSYMLVHPGSVAMQLLVISVEFAVFYALGWILGRGRPRQERISLMLSSGVCNNGVGMGLSFLYFPAETSVFMVLSEIPWALSIIGFRRFVRRGERGRGGMAVMRREPLVEVQCCAVPPRKSLGGTGT